MRYFVTFKKNTNLYGKVMVFTNMLRNEIQDRLVQHYDQLWDKIYTEPELSRVMPETIQKGEFIYFGAEDYILNQEHKVSVSDITLWFKTAKPTPTERNLSTQLEELNFTLNSLDWFKDSNHIAKVIFDLVGLAYFQDIDLDKVLSQYNSKQWESLNETK